MACQDCFSGVFNLLVCHNLFRFGLVCIVLDMFEFLLIGSDAESTKRWDSGIQDPEEGLRK